MRIIKTKIFSKWARKHQVTDKLLSSAAKEISGGHFEANYGSGVIKKRIATKDRGKSASVRTMVAIKKETHCFFVYGFEKNQKSNITQEEEKAIKIVAKALFGYSDDELNKFIADGVLMEIDDEQT